MIDWNTLYSNGASYRPISQREIDVILRYVPVANNIRCLDVGCGTGQLTRELWHRGLQPTGIDISEEALKLARAYASRKEVAINYKLFNLETHDAAQLTVQTFGLITCKLVYAFIKNKATFLGNIVKLLADDGVLVVITPLIEHVPKEKSHIAVTREKTVQELSEFFEVEIIDDDSQVLFICKAKL